MASYLEDDENMEPDQDESTYLSGPASSMGNAKSGGGSTSQPQGGANNTPSRFVEFERYFNANAGGANQMADSVMGGVEEQAKGAKQTLSDEQDEFNSRVQAGIQQPKIADRGYYDYGSTGGVYNGPNEFVPSENTRSSVNGAYAALENLKSPSGWQTAMSELGNKSPTNTIGNDRFNGFLAAQAGANRFSSLWDQYSGLGSAVDDSITGAQGAIDNALNQQTELNKKSETEADLRTNHFRDVFADAEREQKEAEEQIEISRRGPKNRRNFLAD